MDAAQQIVTVKFDGQAHQVDVHTFTNVVLDYSSVLQMTAKEIGVGSPVNVAIAATGEGSLDVMLSVAAEQAGGILALLNDNQGAVEAVGAVVTASIGLYKFKQSLAGKQKAEKKSETPETVTVNADGEDITVAKNVYNVYMNCPNATDAIDNTFSTLDENPAVSGLQMSTNGDVSFRAERDEFSAIASSPNYEGDTTRHIEARDWLTVVKPFLAKSKTRKWEFIYQGSKITACVTDDGFLDSIEAVPFKVGMKMLVDLDIVQEYSVPYDTWLNKKYTVVRVVDEEYPTRDEPLF